MEGQLTSQYEQCCACIPRTRDTNGRSLSLIRTPEFGLRKDWGKPFICTSPRHVQARGFSLPSWPRAEHLVPTFACLSVCVTHPYRTRLKPQKTNHAGDLKLLQFGLGSSFPFTNPTSYPKASGRLLGLCNLPGRLTEMLTLAPKRSKGWCIVSMLIVCE
jgi:hypothetical protein